MSDTDTALLARFRRIAITGAPRAGKSTLARDLDDGRLAVHTDDYRCYVDSTHGREWFATHEAADARLQELAREGVDAVKPPKPWSEVPYGVLEALEGSESFIVEGVQVPRTLRKGLEVDVVLYMPQPRHELSSGQAAMAKGLNTVLLKWRRDYDNNNTTVLVATPDGWQPMEEVTS